MLARSRGAGCVSCAMIGLCISQFRKAQSARLELLPIMDGGCRSACLLAGWLVGWLANQQASQPASQLDPRERQRGRERQLVISGVRLGARMEVAHFRSLVSSPADNCYLRTLLLGDDTSKSERRES